MENIIIFIFVAGYVLIAFEHQLKINKTATALITGILCWTLLALDTPGAALEGSASYTSFLLKIGNSSGVAPADIYHRYVEHELSYHLSQIASILFFLLAAMTIVELVDAHHGFRIITDLIQTKSLRKLLWIVCWITFFLSSVLDNLTTAIVMVSVTRKLVPDNNKRLLFAGMIIVAANAGGAWSPIGDVTTTMLWIGGQVTAMAIVKALFIPSLVCLLIPLLYLTFQLKGELGYHRDEMESHPGNGKVMLIVGIGALVFVPVFKTFTHLPPYMGMLFGLGVLWIVSEFINPALDDFERKKYSPLSALSRIDIPSVLFFMGILLAVGALESMQVLHRFATQINEWLGDNRIIITLIGVVSAIVDNVPLVAACMGMYSKTIYPTDHVIWEYLAYCAGTGGSLLVIGSAAGVAVMGMEKMEFTWYVRRVSLLALIGYAGGALVFLVLSS